MSEPLNDYPPIPTESAPIGTKFQCAMCGREFLTARGDDAAMAESQSHFGAVAREDLTVVCDDCWAKIHQQRN